MSLNQYQKFTNKFDIYPQRILFFRDGVSEGEFHQVAEMEVRSIKGKVTVHFYSCEYTE